MTGLSKAEIEARGHPVWGRVDLAAIRHNINYEVTSRIPSRVPRLYLNESAG